MTAITVTTGRADDILIEKGLLSRCGGLVRDRLGGEKAAVVCDTVSGWLYAPTVEKTLHEAGYNTCRFTLPRGERAKSTDNYVSLLEFLGEQGLSRTDIVVAVGGGVVGDLVGFAAATYMRGIRYVQLPTTLLAMVDSSVGGKTAIDLKSGKNLAGAFWQPGLVVCDTDALETLPDNILAEGCAEAVKYAVLGDGELLELVKNARASAPELVRRCVEMKKAYVEADERDTGVRQKLNLGHTVGHAIEKLTNYTQSHGRAVAAGLCVAVRASERRGACLRGTSEAAAAALERWSLPTGTQLSAAALAEAMRSDKKRSGETMTVVTPVKLGECILENIPADSLAEFFGPGL